MTDVYWLEQTAADVPTGNDWLSAAERLRLQGMRFAKRRADWRLGRWTAKCALAIVLDLSQEPESLATIEIGTLPSGAPEVFLDALSSRVSLSLSHCAGRAVCAVALNSVAVGCDLERIEPHSDAFAADYFSTGEQAMVAQSAAAERSRLLTLLWSAKESALKALQVGLRLDTRSVSVSPGSSLAGFSAWQWLCVDHADGRVFHGWWRQAGDFVHTLVADPPPGSPIVLRRRGCVARPPAGGGLHVEAGVSCRFSSTSEEINRLCRR